jgi:hypothetical protein
MVTGPNKDRYKDGEKKKEKEGRYSDTTGRGDSNICYAFLGRKKEE